MADMHHHRDTRVVEERDGGPATALVAIIIVLLVGFLIWLFAFSGMIFDRGGDGDTQIQEGPRIEQQQPAPGGETETESETQTDGSTTTE